MSITKTELKNRLRRSLGYPNVKVELEDDNYNDIIAKARKVHQKWAVGNATQETFFTMAINSSQREYNLPTGVTSVITMKDYSSGIGNANQLFTIENYMFQQGLFRFLEGGQQFSLIDYHLGLDFLSLLEKYTVSDFYWKYNKYKNTLTLSPTPSATDSNSDYMLIQSFMAEGYDIDYDVIDGDYLEDLYTDDWFFDYCLSEAKITLGYIRRKFQSFQGMGNVSIELDGDQLIQEGKEEKEMLLERLKTEETYEGSGFVIG